MKLTIATLLDAISCAGGSTAEYTIVRRQYIAVTNGRHRSMARGMVLKRTSKIMK